MQLAIWPPQAQYAACSFDWRVSSAVVGAEESVFTRLPDYARHLAILDGQLRLRHNGGGELTLHPFTPHVFDGADETRSCGTCTDFNLMLRKGVCCGRIRPIRTARGRRPAYRPVRRTAGKSRRRLFTVCAAASR